MRSRSTRIAALFSAIALFYLGFDLAIGRHLPALKTSGGAILLALTILGWLAPPAFVVLALLEY